MRRMTSIVVCVACFGVLVGTLHVVHAQSRPDLMVTKIECAAPMSKLQFTVANMSNTPMPLRWRAVADVYFGRGKVGFVDLGTPTSGSIEPAGGTATYLTSFDISRLVTVKVIVNPMNSVKELTTTNNSLTQEVAPCSQTNLLPISPAPQPVPQPGMPGAMPEPIPRPGAMPEPIPTPPTRY